MLKGVRDEVKINTPKKWRKVKDPDLPALGRIGQSRNPRPARNFSLLQYQKKNTVRIFLLQFCYRRLDSRIPALAHIKRTNARRSQIFDLASTFNGCG